MSEFAIEYAFSNATERVEMGTTDIADYTIDGALGADQMVTMLIKWTNQSYHDENLRAMFSDEWDAVVGVAKTNKGRHRNQYYAGKIATVSLGQDYINANGAEAIEDAVQPTGIDTRQDGAMAFACGNLIYLTGIEGGSNDAPTTIARGDFARLHSVEFSEDGNRLLTASSSLDLLYEVDLAGTPTWSMDMWDTPLNRNVLGQRFYRRAEHARDAYTVNPTVDELRDDPANKDGVFVLDDPAQYNHLGLPTNLTPVFPNSVSYGWERDILVTTFHSGQGWIVDRATNKVRIIKDGMKNPHGLHCGGPLDGYMVTDTGNETVNFITADFKHEQILDFSTLGGRKPGLERVRWLQYTTCLSENLYCAVQAPRQALVLFDPHEQTRRDIPFDPNWGVQQVVATK